jgi:hypothetical protein
LIFRKIAKLPKKGIREKIRRNKKAKHKREQNKPFRAVSFHKKTVIFVKIKVLFVFAVSF